MRTLACSATVLTICAIAPVATRAGEMQMQQCVARCFQRDARTPPSLPERDNACLPSGLRVRLPPVSVRGCRDRWSNRACSGQPDSDEKVEFTSSSQCVPDPVHNGAQSPQPDPQLAYQQLLCSDDGSTLVWPHFSDSSCTVETDYNEHELARLAGGAKGLVLEGLKWDVRYSYPEGMRFVSGECVAVATDQTGLWMPGGGQSMKITLDQCFGDEVEAAQERQMLLAVVLVLSSVCVCTGCCLYRCTRKQQQARGGGSFASSVRRYLAPPAVSYTPRPRPLSVDLCVYSSVSDTANDLLSCCFSWRR
jgi:hypothetical protein